MTQRTRRTVRHAEVRAVGVVVSRHRSAWVIEVGLFWRTIRWTWRSRA